MSITSYEGFCEAFRGTDDEQDEAGLLLTMRDWIIRLGDPAEWDSLPTDLDSLLGEDLCFKDDGSGEKFDALSQILNESYQAFKSISGRMRENIIRENVKLPVQKVREMNQYGMMWLSRRPGKTIREKASGTAAIMAVRRRMTLDTGENRLFIEFLKQLSGLLEEKLSSLPDLGKPEEESDMLRQIHTFLRGDELDEIKPWGNLPPNNTLLSDQSYRKIWRGWSDLKQIDDLIEQDAMKLPERMCTIFCVELLKRLKRFCYVPQLPVTLEYSGFQVDVQCQTESIPAADADGNICLLLQREGDRAEIWIKGKMNTVAFDSKEIHFRGEEDIDYPLTEAGMRSCLQDVYFAVSGTDRMEPRPKQTPIRQQDSIVDLFSLRPRYLADSETSVRELSGRLLYQEIPASGTTAEYPCDEAQAVFLSKDMPCYTIRSAMEQGNLHRLSRLTHLLEKYLDTRNLTFLYPDAYTNLQLSLLYKAVRMAYPEVRSFPKSIGAAFFWQNSEGFDREFRDGDFLLSVDLVGDDLTFTLVRGSVDRNTGEIIWERHPTDSKPFSKIHDSLQRFERVGCAESEELYELFGFDGMQGEAGRLAFLSPDMDSGWDSFMLKSVPAFQIPVNDPIKTYLEDRKSLIKGAPVHIQLYSPFITARGDWHFLQAHAYNALLGCKYYQELQANTDTPLWCDYLPQLSIKLLHGEFPLIHQVRVSAQYGERIRIPIDQVFILPKGKPMYQFDLIQSETSKSTRFIAEVRSSAFPLERDTQCRLEMWYQYGAEDPFTLTFLPCDEEQTAFKQATVTWRPRNQDTPYPIDGLPVPGFPQAISWDELARFQGKNGKINIPSQVANTLRLINEKYYTVDLRQKEYRISGDIGRRRFTVECDINKKLIPVIFYETNIERVKQSPRIPDFTDMREISFGLKAQQIERCTASLSCDYYGRVWTPAKNGGFFHYENDWFYDGKYVTLVLYSSEFVSYFDENIDFVSFELHPYGTDNKSGCPRYKAMKIRNGYDNTDDFRYIAEFIRPGNVPPATITNGYSRFLFHTLYSGGKSIFESGCPDELRRAFRDARDEWFDIYERCSDIQTKSMLFGLMSLTSGDLGDRYYRVANQRIDAYQNGTLKLADDVGYALRDCTKACETELLQHIKELKPDKVVCILSKAIWGHPDFILHFPVSDALQYFKEAVEYADSAIALWNATSNKNKRNKYAKDLYMYFEYALGVFRMRQLGDPNVNAKLSLNDKAVQTLYGLVEKAIDDGIPISTFLDLRISDKKQYEGIPDLLYALLVYITGNEEGDSIQISGFSFDDE